MIEITAKSGIPLLGTLWFGIIDRGTNLLQVRPISACNLMCAYCSTSSNNLNMHPNEFVVELDYLLKYVKYAIDFKGENVIIFIDSVGETLLYPKMIELIKGIKKYGKTKEIVIITNGTLLTKEKIQELKKAGLDRINLSINALDGSVAKDLSGTNWYDIKKMIDIVKEIKKSGLGLLLTPVWIPNINDQEIKKLIDLSKELDYGIAIQKYEEYKCSRKVKGSKDLTWWKFYEQLHKWEKEFGIKLKIASKEFGIEKRERILTPIKKGERISCVIRSPGWFKDQMIGVTRDRSISINNCKAKVGDKVIVKIIDDKNGIYIGVCI